MRVGEKRTSASAGAPKTTGGKIKSNPPAAALSTRRGFPHSGLFAAGAQSQREGFGLFQPFQLFRRLTASVVRLPSWVSVGFHRNAKGRIKLAEARADPLSFWQRRWRLPFRDAGNPLPTDSRVGRKTHNARTCGFLRM